MNFIMPLKLALKTLRSQKLRALLTILGIIIGVGSVIAVISFGQAATASVRASMESRGANRITVFPNFSRQGGVSGSANVQTLTVKDAESIERECPSVSYVTPMVRNSGQVVYGNTNWTSSIEGSNSYYAEITGWKFSNGSFFTEYDVVNSNSVCVIGSQVAQELFGRSADAMDKTIRVKKVPFKVIGVIESQGGVGNEDSRIVIPYTTALLRISKVDYVNQIIAQARSRELIDTAIDEITALLRQRHNLLPDQENDFQVRSLEDMINMMSETLGTLTAFLAAVAAVSLLVGGIGIMNIMLVSVSERTKEIGIRMALGAKKSDILMQFLTESIILSIIGGIFGIIIGIAIAVLGGRAAGFPTTISMASIAIAFFFSAAIGIIFGYWPAAQASNLEPIEALRKD